MRCAIQERVGSAHPFLRVVTVLLGAFVYYKVTQVFVAAISLRAVVGASAGAPGKRVKDRYAMREVRWQNAVSAHVFHPYPFLSARRQARRSGRTRWRPRRCCVNGVRRPPGRFGRRRHICNDRLAALLLVSVGLRYRHAARRCGCGCAGRWSRVRAGVSGYRGPAGATRVRFVHRLKAKGTGADRGRNRAGRRTDCSASHRASDWRRRR